MFYGQKNQKDNLLQLLKTIILTISIKQQSKNLTYSSQDNILCLTAKTVLLQLNLMAVKVAKILSSTNYIKKYFILLDKNNTFQVLELQKFIIKKILNFLGNVIFYLIKIDFKSLKQVKICQGPDNIYAHQHAILADSACIYQINNQHTMFLDPVDYLTHEIYFTNSSESKLQSCLGDQIVNKQNLVVQVNTFDYLKDVDYFVKHTQVLQKKRAQQIQRFQKGENAQNHQNEVQKVQGQQQKQKQAKQSDSEYLKRTILPVLQGALKQVTLLRPQDPLGYLALLCLKNKDRVKISK